MRNTFGAAEQYSFLANLGDGAKVFNNPLFTFQCCQPANTMAKDSDLRAEKNLRGRVSARSRKVVCGQLPCADTVKPVGNVLRLVIVKELMDTTGT